MLRKYKGVQVATIKEYKSMLIFSETENYIISYNDQCESH